jgi:NADH:ubiquinone oxidoreductase subunit F (NADH-binding)
VRNDQLPRLLDGTPGTPRTLEQHESAFARTARATDLLDELEASGLTGRGGAAFETARKARLLVEQRGHHKCVIVNAMEGEPASHKDQTLLSTNPHLVLDGAEMLASVIGANKVVICVARDRPTIVNIVKRALHERERGRRRGVDIELRTPPWRYVAGEESALIHWLNDNESLPQYRPQRPTILKLGHHPALVDNAETCANVALIGRFGATWFRGLGPSTAPGSALVSVTGAVDHPVVLEVALGTPLRTILDAAGAHPDPQALLLGGYGGTWLGATHLDVHYDNASLGPYGAAVGAGVVVVLGRGACGLVETTRVVKWMANESARQCGPCAFGLPALGEDLTELSFASRNARAALDRLVERCGAINGRGACHHPDGVVRFVRSALNVFSDDVSRHLQGDACPGSRSPAHYATVPKLEREDELVWQ